MTPSQTLKQLSDDTYGWRRQGIFEDVMEFPALIVNGEERIPAAPTIPATTREELIEQIRQASLLLFRWEDALRALSPPPPEPEPPQRSVEHGMATNDGNDNRDLLGIRDQSNIAQDSRGTEAPEVADPPSVIRREEPQREDEKELARSDQEIESRFAELIASELEHYAQKIAKRVLRKALGGKIAERDKC